MPNRLARESSPYLLQHAHNPVDWYPWGEEALARARAEDRPILLSIGYSACHWCHVMERESFEDAATAELMNRSFVSVKVDREERPDLDSIYMRGVQALTGGGGWPLTAFLTPEGRLFYGGTYFPPAPRYGMPSFRQVLEAVASAWRERRDEVERTSRQLLEALRGDRAAAGEPQGAAPRAPGPGTLEGAFRFLARRFDPSQGGFGPPPKFPQPMNLELLLRHHHRTGREEALDMVIKTLLAMARGGIRDHVGGGFHRYSVDGRWLVPHFEKMLYDNGLLARIYLQAFQVTGNTELRDAATSTLDYILEDLTSPEGGFYSARDADSQGEEGVFYLWTAAEVDEALEREEGELFRRVYDVTPEGNFEGRSILHLPHGLEGPARSAGMEVAALEERLARARAILKERRGLREHPFRDEKVLVSWNSFALQALAEAGAVLGREGYIEAARANADFLLGSLRRGDRLLRSWKAGPGRVEGFLEDYAGLGNALLSLFESTLEPRWLEEARRLGEQVVELFWEEVEGRFYDAPRDAEALVVRPRDIMDNAIPSGNSLAVELLLRLAHLAGWERGEAVAGRVLEAERGGMEAYPSAFGALLNALDRHRTPPLEIVILGGRGEVATGAFHREASQPYLPNRVLVGGWLQELPALPVLQGKEPRNGETTAWVCREMTCSPALATVEELRGALAEGEQPRRQRRSAAGAPPEG